MKLAFTGHRPAGIVRGLGLPSNLAYSATIRELLEDIAHQAIEHTGASRVISGGALGVDQAAAEAALLAGIPLSMYLPFEGFDQKWPKSSRQMLANLIDQADEVRYISDPGYASSKLQRRNEAMVDGCDRLAAVWSGSAGGTANCLQYARTKDIRVTQCWKALAHAASLHPKLVSR